MAPPAIPFEEGTQGLQPLGSRGSKAVLASTGGNNDAIDGGRGLIGPMAASKLLDSFVC